MKDNAIKWLTELNPFDKVKGHTKIELIDVKTGKKQVIEKDNAFQAGVLAKYMRSMGAYNNNPYANGTWAGQPIWRNLCGGIFCFRDPIDNSEDEVEYMPAGNEMVANGAYMVNNAGTPIELGSYNEVESSTSGNDSVTFVYDWMTSQGNGTISCVCLTTEIGGYIGYGNPSGQAHATKKTIQANQNSANIIGEIYNNERFEAAFASDGTLTITRTPIEVSQGSVFDGLSVTETYSITNTANAIGCRMPCHIGNGVFAIPVYYSAGWNSYHTIANGGTVYYIEYDSVNKTATMASFTNNTGYTLIDQRGYGAPCVRYYEGGKAYIGYYKGSGGDPYNKVLLISTTTGALLDEVTIGNNVPIYFETALAALTDELFMYDMQGSNTSGNSNMGILDPVKHTAYPTNGSALFAYGGFVYQRTLDAFKSNSMSSTPSQGYINGYLYKNPLILATINNLDTPVTKTAAQTMKITYTLSKASE